MEKIETTAAQKLLNINMNYLKLNKQFLQLWNLYLREVSLISVSNNL